MKFRLTFASLLVAACSSSPLPITTVDGAPITSVPSDWLTIDSKCGFSFRAPPSFQARAVEPVAESCNGIYEGESIRFGYNYGKGATPFNDLKDAPNAKEEAINVNGAAAKLLTCDESARRFIGLYVENDGRGKKLQATSMCSNKKCEDTVRTVVSSIVWK